MVRTFVLAVVLAVDAVLLVAVIVRPWLIAVGVLVALRLSRGEGSEKARDFEEMAVAAVGIGMPYRLARWLRPRHGRNTQEERYGNV